jgi:MFS family permease
MASSGAGPAARGLLIGGIATFMIVMGIGRFAYTPILPDMIANHLLDVKSAGLLASSNFVGYLMGALGAALFSRATIRRWMLIGAILASVLTTFAMGLTQSQLLWHGLRFASGVASAFALIFSSGFLMEALVARGRTSRIGWLYGGLGLGVASSSVVIELLQEHAVRWDWQWLASGALAALCAVPALWVAFAIRPVDAPKAAAAAGAAPRTRLFGLHFTLLVIAYGGMGVGYVVQATYLPTMVRSLPGLGGFSTLAWMVMGLAAAPSNILWQVVGRRIGVMPALILGYLVQAAGVMLPVLWLSVAGAMLGAAALGATLIGITALALQQVQTLAHGQIPRAIALITASFGLGQILGPPAAAMLVGPDNDFLLPSIMAAAVLVLSALLLLPLLLASRSAVAAR